MTTQNDTLVFLFGTLRDAQLARIVFGAEVPAVAARLPGYETRRASGGDWPTLVAEPDASAEGLCLRLTADALDRGDFYEALFGYTRAAARVLLDGAERSADVWFPPHPGSAGPSAWDLADWQAGHADLARMAAADVMALRGAYPVARTAARFPSIRARAQARLNARDGGPTSLRRPTSPGDVDVSARRTPYAGFFAVEEYDLRHARFDGTMSAQITRAAFVCADAVTVLPYDPQRDRVLLIEQFRPGPLARGDAQLWSLEAIAGRIDPGETPQDAARREAREEAGLDIGALLPLAEYYPTPGAASEFLYSFVALADLPDIATRLGGVETEHEDIRAHVVAFDRLMALVASGEVNNAPLLLSALLLASRRAELREGAGVPTPAEGPGTR